MRDIVLRRSLPVAPEALPARRHLPLAPESRAADQVRPIYAVWEITLRCDLACVHCGSRAGRARPDELTTAECLDLVDQMADLGVREVTLIGGEAYLRDDWLDIVRALRRRGLQASMTTGGRGLTSERANAAAAAGLQSASVSLDGLEATHDRLRGVRGSYQSALAALANLRAAGIGICVNTQVNRLSMPELPAILETVIAVGGKAWQVQLTAAMGRAADQPELLPQPFDLLELFPMLAELKGRCDEASVRLWPGNNLGLFWPLRVSPARDHATRAHGLMWRRAQHAGNRGGWGHQRLSVAANQPLDRGQHPRRFAA
ncbi:MAG: radical SAM protein [Myxococcales bacterium]